MPINFLSNLKLQTRLSITNSSPVPIQIRIHDSMSLSRCDSSATSPTIPCITAGFSQNNLPRTSSFDAHALLQRSGSCFCSFLFRMCLPLSLRSETWPTKPSTLDPLTGRRAFGGMSQVDDPCLGVCFTWVNKRKLMSCLFCALLGMTSVWLYWTRVRIGGLRRM